MIYNDDNSKVLAIEGHWLLHAADVVPTLQEQRCQCILFQRAVESEGQRHFEDSTFYDRV